MADEVEKKRKIIVRKNQAAAQPSAGESTNTAQEKEKKRVVVIKKKTPARTTAKKTEDEKQPVSEDSLSKKPEVEQAASKKPLEKKQQSQETGKNTRSSNKKEQTSNVRQSENVATVTVQEKDGHHKVYKLASNRPNIKAGNLSDRARNGQRNYFNRNNQGGGNSGGYGQGRGGYQNRGQGNNYGQQGFSGAQARANYQNRGQDGQRQQGGFGGNRMGGFRHGPGAAPTPTLPTGKQGKKAAFKGKKIYGQQRNEEYDNDKFFEQRKKSETIASAVPKSIDIMETISVSDLARKMNLKANEIIGKLMSMGMMVTINQSVDSDTATLLANEYGCEVHLVSLYDETVIASDVTTDATGRKPRAPIVTVMGHVDHGKTKTLDAIRKTNVVAGEAGGITQSIGAYSVTHEKGIITFLDTPGHEAFTMMRARGAQVTDIVVLVVAADDGVMPQTLEAIDHAKDAKVPIIVAVNKIDKPEANPDRVKTQLSELDLTPEEWGGQTQYVNISALKGEGIDDLLDAILLQAEILELTADYDCRAEGKIIESRIDQGRGIVATVMVQQGTLKVGDPFVAGIYSGHVRALFNDRGHRIQEALPSTPVEVLGLENIPSAGDPFQVTESEKDARTISSKRQELKRFEDAKAVKKVTIDNMFQTIDASKVMEFRVLIKADLHGSAEALKTALEKLSTPEIRLVVIHSSAGAINESDVMLAAADKNSILIGFNVRPTAKAKALADQERVEIRRYNIIYKAVEEIKSAMEGMLTPDTKEQIIGSVEVRDTFKVPKIGVIAGCYVTEGVVKRSASINLIRDDIVIFTGKISSLKRFKDDAKEVAAGYECGIGLVDWQDIKVGDVFEVIEYIQVARKLGDSIAASKAAAATTAAE